jgi:hypothetical protein
VNLLRGSKTHWLASVVVVILIHVPYDEYVHVSHARGVLASIPTPLPSARTGHVEVVGVVYEHRNIGYVRSFFDDFVRVY